MESMTYRLILRTVKLLNVVLMVLPLMICWCTVYAPAGTVEQAVLIAVLFAAQYMIFGRVYQGFLISLVRISEMVYSQCLTLLVTDSLMYLVICLSHQRLAAPVPLLAVLGIQMVLSVVWCTGAHIWYFKKFAPKETVIIYGSPKDITGMIQASGLSKKFRVQRSVSVEECLRSEFALLEGAETVFLCGVGSHERNRVLKYCVRVGITVYVLPRIGDILMSGARKMHLFRLPFLRVNQYDPAPDYWAAKRVFDLTVSLAALLATSPVLLLTAAAIKLSDGGPVFYRQKRLTRRGKEFNILKFRSMRVDAERDGVARLSAGDLDDRITPVGRVIRKLRIDELPQFFNILMGDMSVVGPRPERPEIAAQYEQELPEFSLRLQAKAGLTGYAQVYGKYNTTPYDKLQMDLMYIANPSFLEDLRIVLATVKILFLPESTEGVAAGCVTAMEQKEEQKQ